MEEEDREGNWVGGSGEQVEEGKGREEGGTWEAHLCAWVVAACSVDAGV